MGFDLFMAVVAIVLAAFLTWLILWWYFTSDTGAGTPRTTPVPAETREPTGEGDSAAPHRSELKPLVIAAVLTAPVLMLNLWHVFSGSTLPGWTDNLWLQVIAITPVLFYCGAPIAVEGWASLKRRTADMNTLIMIGDGAAYIYSLALCILAGVLPNDPNGPYFGVVGLAVSLALLSRLLELRAVRRHGAAVSSRGVAATSVRRYYRLVRYCVPTAMVVATWSFTLSIVFGYQPRLAHAIVAGFSVLIIVGLVLAGIKAYVAWGLLRGRIRRRRTS